MSNALKLGSPLKLHNKSVDPSGEEGLLYYNTADFLAKLYANGSWEKLATKSYADSIAAGFDPKQSCVAATTAALPSVSYNNGASGVGATLTATANGALPAQDGVTLTVGQRLLVKDQAAPAIGHVQNGIYVVTAVGDGSNPFILTRATDFDGAPSNEVDGGEFTFIARGSTLRGSAWVVFGLSAAAVFGTTAIKWTQIKGDTTLQNAYVSGEVITTSATEGAFTIAGTEILQVTTTGGLNVNGGILTVFGSGATNSAEFNNSGSGYALQASTGGGTGDAFYAYANGASASAISGESDSATAATLKLRNTASGAVIQLLGDTSGALDLLVPASFTSYSLTLPSDDGAASQFLQTDGSGVLSWATVAADTLQSVYDADVDGSDAIITTNATDGAVKIAGSEKLWVTATGGFDLDSLMTLDYTGTSSGLQLNKAGASGDGLQVAMAAGSGIGVYVTHAGTGNAFQAASAGGHAAELENSSATNQTLRLRNANSSGALIRLTGTTTGDLGIAVPNTVTSYNITLPSAQGAASTFLQNDGSGGLSWAAAAAATLQSAYDADVDGTDAIITTNATDGAVKIAGDQKLWVSATGGFDLDSLMTLDYTGTSSGLQLNKAGASGDGLEVAMAAGSGLGVSVSHAGTGSCLQLGGTSTAARMRLAGSTSGTISINVPAVVTATDTWILPGANGAASSFLQNDGSGVLSWTTIAADTLQSVYDADADGADATIATNATDGSVVIYGDQSFIVGATAGFKLAADNDKTKFVQEIYKDGLSLTASSTLVLSGLNLAHATYSGQVIEYRIKEATSNAIRIGSLLVSTDGTLATVTDTYTETADVGVTWSAAVSGANVELTYTTTANAKTMHAALRRFLLA